MTTAYHRNVQKCVRLLGQRCPERFRVYNGKRPVHIVHPTKNKSFLYYPDVRFETRVGKTYIFEIMDTEARKQAHVVAHVVEAYLTPHVLKVLFIVRNQKDQQTVSQITEVVLGRLEDLGGGKVNKQVRFYYVIVSPEDSRSSDRVAKALAGTGVL